MTLSPKLGVVGISTLWHFRLPLPIQMFTKVASSPRLSGIGMPSPILWSHPLKMQRIVLLSSLLWWELGTNSLITGPGEWLSFRRFTSKLSWSWSWFQSWNGEFETKPRQIGYEIIYTTITSLPSFQAGQFTLVTDGWKQNVNRKVTIRNLSQPLTPRESEKVQKKITQNKQTNAREAHRQTPSSPSEVITMLKGLTKHEDKEHGKTKHESPRSINHKATQIRTTPAPPP